MSKCQIDAKKEIVKMKKLLVASVCAVAPMANAIIATTERNIFFINLCVRYLVNVNVWLAVL